MFTLAYRKFSSSIGVSLLVLCMLGVGFLQLPQLTKHNSRTNASLETLKRETYSEKLRLNLLQKLPTFGFNNLIADSIFLKFLQYFGDDEARVKTGYRLSPEYFEVILGRDPHFLQAYLFLSTSTSLYAGMPERSIALMEKGLKSLSPKVPQKSYYIWRYKGIDELLFLGAAPQAQHSFEMAAQWASSYSDQESQQVKALSLRTSQFLAHNPKSRSAQIAAWIMVLDNPVDTQTRKLALRRISKLGGKVSITPKGALKVQPPQED